MKKSHMLAFTAALSLASTALAPTAFAEEKKVPNAYTECGIGAALFPNSTTWAAISNVIWDWGTTALSSATMSPEQCTGASAKTAMLIGKTYASIEADLVVGQGQYLSAVADVMNCSQASRGALYSEVRAKFADVAAQPKFASMTKDQKAESLYLIVDSTVSSNFSNQCVAA